MRGGTMCWVLLAVALHHVSAMSSCGILKTPTECEGSRASSCVWDLVSRVCVPSEQAGMCSRFQRSRCETSETCTWQEGTGCLMKQCDLLPLRECLTEHTCTWSSRTASCAKSTLSGCAGASYVDCRSRTDECYFDSATYECKEGTACAEVRDAGKCESLSHCLLLVDGRCADVTDRVPCSSRASSCDVDGLCAAPMQGGACAQLVPCSQHAGQVQCGADQHCEWHHLTGVCAAAPCLGLGEKECGATPQCAWAEGSKASVCRDVRDVGGADWCAPLSTAAACLEHLECHWTGEACTHHRAATQCSSLSPYGCLFAAPYCAWDHRSSHACRADQIDLCGVHTSRTACKADATCMWSNQRSPMCLRKDFPTKCGFRNVASCNDDCVYSDGVCVAANVSAITESCDTDGSTSQVLCTRLGCNWSADTCTLAGHCGQLPENSCKAAGHCSWGTTCTPVSPPVGCSMHGWQVSCMRHTDCLWDTAHTKCQSRDLVPCYNVDQSTCKTAPACEWSSSAKVCYDVSKPKGLLEARCATWGRLRYLDKDECRAIKPQPARWCAHSTCNYEGDEKAFCQADPITGKQGCSCSEGHTNPQIDGRYLPRCVPHNATSPCTRVLIGVHWTANDEIKCTSGIIERDTSTLLQAVLQQSTSTSGSIGATGTMCADRLNGTTVWAEVLDIDFRTAAMMMDTELCNHLAQQNTTALNLTILTPERLRAAWTSATIGEGDCHVANSVVSARDSVNQCQAVVCAAGFRRLALEGPMMVCAVDTREADNVGSGGLSSASIVGIVIASVVILGITGLLGWMFLFKATKVQPSQLNKTTPSDEL